MKNLFYNTSQVLGVSIIHSLWQGLLIYLLLRLLFIACPSLSSNKKHNLLFIGLAMLTIWFACTFFIETKDYDWVINTFTPAQSVGLNAAPTHYLPATVQQPPQSFFKQYQLSVYHIIKIYLPYISTIYIIGLIINLGRLGFAWEKIRLIKQGTAATGVLQQQVTAFCKQLVITKNVRLRFSNLVDIPCTVGYLKPILLLPVTLTTQLSADEVEAILLHELWHIKNNDYLLNLIQQVMTILLFLNPFAQLISRMISQERENRCDDAVVQITHAPLVYAHALVKLEDARQTESQLALAATGKKQHLFSRIERIMKQKKPAVNIRHLFFALIIFIGSVGSIAWLNPEIKNGEIVSKRGAQAIHKLTAIVKKVMAPDTITNTPNIITEQAKKTIATWNNQVTDTTKTVTETTKADTTVITVAQRTTLLDRYRQSQLDLAIDNARLNALPQYQAMLAARKLLDSMGKIKIVITPVLEQQSKENKKAWGDFNNSPEQLKKTAEYQRLVSIYFKALAAEPESIQFKKDQDRQRDSILNKIQQSTGLTKEQIKRTNPEYRQWLIESGKEQDILNLKLRSNPELKIISDSLAYATRQLYSGYEFDAINNKTKASKEQIEAQNTPALQQYRSAYMDAIDKVHNSPEWKKYIEDINRDNYLVDKLKSKLIP